MRRHRTRMSHEDPETPPGIRRALAELGEMIRELPAEMRMEVFLLVCAELLRPMSREAVLHLREVMRQQFPELPEDSEVMNLIAGHLAWRELTPVELAS